MTSLALIFLAGAAYSYLFYPLLLLLIPARRTFPAPRVIDDAELPSITAVIAAHNEASTIADKLADMAALDYPQARLQVIVASDCSDDGTDDIARSFTGCDVRLVRTETRGGKENAIRAALTHATGDLIVFSDVGTRIPPDALRRLAGYFEASEVGAVSSEDRFVSADGSIAGEGLYVRYEMWLRRLESTRAGLVGLSGSFFAARRAVCTNWDPYSCSDFLTALNTSRLGLVAISAPDVVGIYRDVADASHEYPRKVRTVARGMLALLRHRDVLHPRRGLFAFQAWSHKIARWSVPWMLLGVLLCTLFASDHGPLWTLLALGQLVGYGTAIGAYFAPRLREIAPVRIIYYFVQVNVAIAEALVRIISGERFVTWAPSRR